jgi:hydroxyethylthiazole kinase-like uncharacterized protein yjeF
MKAIDVLSLRHRLVRPPDAHKGAGGRVILVGGQQGMTGALVLAGMAALFSGAGWVELAFLCDPAPLVIGEHPELMLRSASDFLNVLQTNPSSLNALGIGPGMGQSPLAKQLLAQSLPLEMPLVVDADALHLLAQDPNLMAMLRARPLPAVLTPHPGEAGVLLGCTAQQIQADRPAAVRRLVELTHSVVVLKGQGSLCAGPGLDAGISGPEICLAGNAGMGAGGMGDVLTGLTAALLSQGLRRGLGVWDLTRLAVQLHATAADELVHVQHLGPLGLTASEVAKGVRPLLNAP